MLRVQKLHPDAKLPYKARYTDAGYDLYSIDNVVIRPGEIATISTGIAIEIPPSYVGLIWDRSNLGSKGIHRLAGVIDSSYRGCIKVCLVNLKISDYLTPDNKGLLHDAYEIKAGDRIAQIIFQKYEELIIKEVDKLSDTDRGTNGFGSTGR